MKDVSIFMDYTVPSVGTSALNSLRITTTVHPMAKKTVFSYKKGPGTDAQGPFATPWSLVLHAGRCREKLCVYTGEVVEL